MARYAWATDVHLDFLRGNQARLIQFAESLVKDGPEGILLTGDLSTAKDLVFHLSAIERVVQRPVYFVLGNHDYYGSSIELVRKTMKELTNVSGHLRYLPTMPYIALTPATAVVGHDGWYDALIGDWQNSNFEMSDWHYISEFAAVNGNKASIVNEARKQALEAVQHVHDGIKKAVRYHKNIVVLTHFVPFKQAHIYNGRIGDDNAQPWFTSKMMGDMLLDAAKAFPTHHFKVLAGHTHGKFDGKIANNLEVHVGGAEYNQPGLQGYIEVA